MSWPAPTRKDHEACCTTEGWRPVRNARGRTGSHHISYELDLPDGRILRTRVSHPPDRTGYGPSLWNHILRDQIQVDEPEFWACVRDGTKPARGRTEPPPDALPAELVHLLITRVGLTDAEIAALSKAEAVARLNQYWEGDG